MQTIYFENRSIKEKILSDMLNLVRVFSGLVIILSIVLVTIQVCETAKRDFKLRNIFRFMDDKKVTKKTKKAIKELKDFKVHVFDGKNGEKLISSETGQHRIHTLMPFPLPVHLPVPSHPGETFVENGPFSPPPHAQQQFPMMHPDHLPFHHDSHFHNPSLAHHHHHHPPPPPLPPHLHSHQISEPLLMHSDSSMLRSMSPHLLIHQEFDPMPLPIDMTDQMKERIAYPVFEIIDDNPLEHIRNVLHPNAHSYGNNEDSIRTNFETDSKNNRNNHLKENKDIYEQKISNENKDTQTSVRLVNSEKFNTIHNINSNCDKYFDEESSNSRKVVKSDDNFRKLDERQTPYQKHRNRNQENQLRPLDNRIDEEVYSEPVPDEQVINIVEDEWTFKDLDLWILR